MQRQKLRYQACVSALCVFSTRPYSLPFPFSPFADYYPAPHGNMNSVQPGPTEFFSESTLERR